MEKDISSGDPEVIKKRRSTIQRMMTTVHNCLGKMLAKSAGKFDHDKIDSSRRVSKSQRASREF